MKVYDRLFPLILILIFAAAAAAQVGKDAEETVYVYSFGQVPTGQFRAVLDTFLADVMRGEKGTRGVVVNYGTVREVGLRKQIIGNHVVFRGFDPSLITFIRGGNVSDLRTDLWVVPAGAADPRIEPEAFVAAEFGRVTRNRARAVISNYFVELNKVPDHQGYIIIYGTEAQMNMQEKWVLSDPYQQRRIHDQSRITIVRGGKRKSGIGTVMWLVPPGAANPTP